MKTSNPRLKTFGTIEQVRRLPVRRFVGDPVEWSIYALIDPRDQTVRYIGATTNLVGRFRAHVKRSSNKRVRELVEQLKSEGQRLRLETLAMTSNRCWDLCEAAWIRETKARYSLFNVNPGGEGAVLQTLENHRWKKFHVDSDRINPLNQLFNDE